MFKVSKWLYWPPDMTGLFVSGTTTSMVAINKTIFFTLKCNFQSQIYCYSRDIKQEILDIFCHWPLVSDLFLVIEGKWKQENIRKLEVQDTNAPLLLVTVEGLSPSGPPGGILGPDVGLQPPALELKVIYTLILS